MAPLDDHLHLLVQLVTSHQAAVPDHKIICFFPTARATQLAAELFVALGRPVTEIHSRKSQGHRTKAADAFRESKSGVMMSSDVSARGLDYPDVTLVVQVGLPSSREQYIHRLGRTARAGKTGEGLLLLAPHEEFFTRQLRDLPITNAPAGWTSTWRTPSTRRWRESTCAPRNRRTSRGWGSTTDPAARWAGAG